MDDYNIGLMYGDYKTKEDVIKAKRKLEMKLTKLLYSQDYLNTKDKLYTKNILNSNYNRCVITLDAINENEDEESYKIKLKECNIALRQLRIFEHIEHLDTLGKLDELTKIQEDINKVKEDLVNIEKVITTFDQYENRRLKAIKKANNDRLNPNPNFMNTPTVSREQSAGKRTRRSTKKRKQSRKFR